MAAATVTSKGQVTLPVEARKRLGIRAGSRLEFVVKDDQTVELRGVTVGRSQGNETILTNGVAENETIVTDGHLRLVPGSHVVVKNDAQRAGQ